MTPGSVTQVPPIIVTPGEPGGVGPEIAIKAWQQLRHEPALAFALLCDITHLQMLAHKAGLDVKFNAIDTLSICGRHFADGLPVLDRRLTGPVQLGKFNSGHAQWVLAAIREAASACMSGTASAMVTCPIHKEALYSAGFKHQGHTDFLAHLAREAGHEAHDVMLLVGGGLRAVPVTVHIALKDVPRQLTREAIVTQAQIVAHDLVRKFGIARPRLAVTGLNPHAGENGSMGREEIEIILPAIEALRSEGLSVVGPLPADSAFIPETRESYDAILCMYHDQALIPVKALDFHGGVNATLGLPFIRTSPDHGTALAIAGTGTAKPESLIAAIRLASSMARTSASG